MDEMKEDLWEYGGVRLEEREAEQYEFKSKSRY